MTSPIRRDIEREARSAILNRAIFRVENALLIAGSVLLAAFFPQPFPSTLPWFDWWTWLALGALGVAGVVISTLRDSKERSDAVAQMFREQHDARLIKDQQLRAKYERALEYYDRLQVTAAQMKSEPMRERTSESVSQMEQWIANIYWLALRIQAYREDGLVRRDRKQTPESMRSLNARLKQETDPEVAEQLRATLASQQQQWQNLETLDNLMEKADLQLDHSVAALGTAYSQLLLIGSKRELDSAGARSLQESITDEVTSLQDLVDSINEVYDYRVEIENVKRNT